MRRGGAKEGLVAQTPKVTFDDILEEVGGFGRYQKVTYFLLFLPTIFSAMQKQSWVFLGAKAPHRCRMPGELDNSAYHDYTQEGFEEHLLMDMSTDVPHTCAMLNKEGNLTNCENGWIFDTTTFGSSAVMDWELVCERKELRATAQAIFMTGVMLGSYIFGWLSDKCGRKISFFISIIMQTLFGVLSGLVPNYWAFVLLRMVVGATTSGVFLVAYVLAMEMVGPQYRVMAGTICQYYYTFGYLTMAGLAFLLNDSWQLLQIVLTLPSILFLSYWWIVPESVRWQLSNGRYEEAKVQLLGVARRNGASLGEETLDSLIATNIQENERKAAAGKTSLWDIFRSRTVLLRTVNICAIWMVCSGIYYGLSLSASNLGGNPYYNYLISAAVEIPAFGFNLLVLDSPRVGRRLALSGCMLLAGVVLVLSPLIPPDQSSWLVALSMLGKLAITSAYGTVYIFSTELFPTRVRSLGLGASSMAARVGGILCPYVNMLSDAWVPAPNIIYGGLAVLGGLSSLLLPETRGKQLPDDEEEEEEEEG